MIKNGSTTSGICKTASLLCCRCTRTFVFWYRLREGWAVRSVATLLGQQGEFYGLDIWPNMIEKAKEQSHDFPYVHFDQGNAEQLPFRLISLI